MSNVNIGINPFAKGQRRLPVLAVAVLLTTLAVALACTQPTPAPSTTVELTPPAVNTVSPPPDASTVAPPQAVESEAVPATEQPVQSGTPETEVQMTSAAVVAAQDEVMSNIYERTVPSVVGLRVIKSITIGGTAPGMPQGDFLSRAAGSGFVWDDEGHVVTNKHVIDGADRIIVVMSDGVQTAAELVGDDPDSDLAVIKIIDDTVRPPAIALGDSDFNQAGPVGGGDRRSVLAGVLDDIGHHQRRGQDHQSYREQFLGSPGGAT